MGEDSNRVLPDKIETIGLVACAGIFLAVAVQSIDNPISARGLGQSVGISAIFLLIVWLLYAKPTTNLVVFDRWLGTSLLLIGTVVTLSAALVNWPIGSGFVFGFGPVVVIIFLWSFVFVIRSGLS